MAVILWIVAATSWQRSLHAQSPTYRLNFTWPAFYLVTGPGTVAGVPSVAPKGALFKIVDADVEGGKMDVSFTSLPNSSDDEILAGLSHSPLQARVTYGESLNVVTARTDGVGTGNIYRVSKVDLPNSFYTLQSGVDFGTLAVPFRLQLKDGALTAGSALGLYAGYRQRWLSWPSTLLASVGLAVVPTTPPTAAGQAADIDNTTALTAAIGLVFEPLPQVQLGIIAGLDHTGKASSDYKYEDHRWLTLAIGFGFIRR